jgi:hypothetical protein
MGIVALNAIELLTVITLPSANSFAVDPELPVPEDLFMTLLTDGRGVRKTSDERSLTFQEIMIISIMTIVAGQNLLTMLRFDLHMLHLSMVFLRNELRLFIHVAVLAIIGVLRHWRRFKSDGTSRALNRKDK